MVHGGRVRAGYRIGELLYQEKTGVSAPAAGSGARRPTEWAGIGHRPFDRRAARQHAPYLTFSACINAVPPAAWSIPGRTDHNLTRVVSGVADTALQPAAGAQASVKIIEAVRAKGARPENSTGELQPIAPAQDAFRGTFTSR